MPKPRLCGGIARDVGAVDAGCRRRRDRAKPAIIISVVVLPEPDGPSSEKNSPGAIEAAIPLDDGLLAVALGQTAQFDRTAARRRGRLADRLRPRCGDPRRTPVLLR